LQLDFWKIAMRPGKPLMFGRLEAMPMLGLPGNPVSAFVCALLFLRPAIERLSGVTVAELPFESARLGAPMKANDQREDYVRASLAQDHDGWIVCPFPVQDSGMLRTLALAEALIIRKPHAPAADAGQAVQILRLDL
jgi:molybdopterin molybdotransferase